VSYQSELPLNQATFYRSEWDFPKPQRCYKW